MTEDFVIELPSRDLMGTKRLFQVALRPRTDNGRFKFVRYDRRFFMRRRTGCYLLQNDDPHAPILA